MVWEVMYTGEYEEKQALDRLDTYAPVGARGWRGWLLYPSLVADPVAGNASALSTEQT